MDWAPSEKFPYDVIDGEQRCGTACMHADRRAAKIEKIGNAKGDVVLLVTDFDSELAGKRQQLRMSDDVGGVVVIVARSGKYADTSVVSLLIVSGVFQSLLRKL